jgi:hypothetical protein
MAIEIFDVPSHWYEKVTAHPVLETNDPGEEVCSIVTPDLEPGTYNIAYSFQCTFSGKNLAAHFGLTGDKADSEMFSISAGDNDELHKNRLYGYPFEWPGGVLTAGLNFKKDAGLASFVVDYADLIISRVG